MTAMMKRILILFILFVMCLGYTATVSCALDWDSENSYRLIVEFEPDKINRSDFPVSVEVCFPKLFVSLSRVILAIFPLRYFLIAPKVSPLTRYFCITIPNTTGGMAAIIARAAFGP